MKYNFSKYKTFQEFCEKNNLTKSKGIEILERELVKMNDESIDFAKEYKNKVKTYEKLVRMFLVKNLADNLLGEKDAD